MLWKRVEGVCVLFISRNLLLLDSDIVQKVTNHPVHIVEIDGNFSPTALIPFCDLGGNMSALGIKIDSFSVPVCNIFKPKVFHEQLCYEMNPNNYIQNQDLRNTLHTGLTLIISHNSDRRFDKNGNNVTLGMNSLDSYSLTEKEKKTGVIYLGTKGVYYNGIWNFNASH